MERKWIRITILVYIFTSIEGTELNLTMMETMPGYAVTGSIEQLNATRCRDEMEQFRDAVNRRELWGLKILDTSGQPLPGYILGNNYWTGDRSECDVHSQKLMPSYSIKNTRNNSLYRNPAVEYPPFEFIFFGIYIHQSGTTQYHSSSGVEDIIILGLCLPASCTEHEVATMVTKVLDDRLLLVARLYSLNLKLHRVSNLRIDYASFFDAKIIMITIILGALFGVVIVGTLYDVLVVQMRYKKNQEHSNSQSKVIDLMDPEKMELKTNEAKEVSYEEGAVIPEKSVSRNKEFLTYISLYSNIQKVFEVGDRSNDIKVVHGIKVLGSFWAIFAHTIIYKSNIANRGEMMMLSTFYWFQTLENAPLTIETFLLIGGFLQTVKYLKSQKKARSFLGHATNFANNIFQRYIRLTPAYLVIILLVIVTFTYFAKTSLIYTIEPVHELCSKNWWTNILYINNLYHWKELCMSWTYYLSNDMQFFMFGMFLLMLSTSYYYTSLSIGVIVIIATSAYRGYHTYDIEYVGTFDDKFETLTDMYIRPWMRIQPYLVGMGIAMLLNKINYKLHISKKVSVICWSLSFLCILTILFGIPIVTQSLNLAIVYEIFFKLGWSFGISWILIACLTDNGGIVNAILSLPQWVPFSRVSLTAYLLNPFVIFLMDSTVDAIYYTESFGTIIVGLGQCGVTYFFAFIMNGIAEVPRQLLLPSRTKR